MPEIPSIADSAHSVSEARRFSIGGRVQGVGFRWFVYREASALNLHGSVWNTEEGGVAVLAAGAHEAINKLREALQRGPRGSRVDRVEEEELSTQEAAKLGPFNIQGAV